MRTVDVISDLLGRAHAQGAVFAHSLLRHEWGIRLDHLTTLTVHVVVRGEALVEVDGTVVRLLPGDIAIVAGAGHHRVMSHEGAACRDLAAFETFRIPGTDRFDVPGSGPAVELVCGSYVLDGSICDRLLADLPDLVHIRAGDGSAADTMRDLMGCFAREVREQALGRAAVLDRLLDALVVLALRSWFDEPGHAPAWYAALSDDAVGRALELIHTRPAEPWSVASLAAEVGVSRSTLARRFGELVGSPPLAYLTRWRLDLATQHLRSDDRSIRAIARSVGYENEFAFSTAFRRVFGVPPTEYRARVRRGAA